MRMIMVYLKKILLIPATESKQHYFSYAKHMSGLNNLNCEACSPAPEPESTTLTPEQAQTWVLTAQTWVEVNYKAPGSLPVGTCLGMWAHGNKVRVNGKVTDACMDRYREATT